jgi:Kef-type K+ transport system membrane component KefB
VFESILALGIILWLGLGIAVGFHAKGHNRSGIVWFFVVAITGIIGVAIYLLAITSANSDESERDSQTDKKIIVNFPLVVGGSIAGLLIGFGFVVLLYYTIPSVTRPEPFYGLILIMGLIGAGGGPYAYSRAKGALLG